MFPPVDLKSVTPGTAEGWNLRRFRHIGPNPLGTRGHKMPPCPKTQKRPRRNNLARLAAAVTPPSSHASNTPRMAIRGRGCAGSRLLLFTCQRAPPAPSPRRGEGWGEGRNVPQRPAYWAGRRFTVHPHPNLLPEGEGPASPSKTARRILPPPSADVGGNLLEMADFSADSQPPARPVLRPMDLEHLLPPPIRFLRFLTRPVLYPSAPD